jgi:Ca2+-binding RTX toxin-like protein
VFETKRIFCATGVFDMRLVWTRNNVSQFLHTNSDEGYEGDRQWGDGDNFRLVIGNTPSFGALAAADFAIAPSGSNLGAITSSLNVPAAFESEVTYISGVTSAAKVAATSFGAWQANDPATYKPNLANVAKWGGTTLSTDGTPGGNVTFKFDAGSNWNTAEQNAFIAGLHLWSAEANISFSEVSSSSSADVTFTRGTDGKANTSGFPNSNIGAGAEVNPGAITISIDTSGGFGPLGDPSQSDTFSRKGEVPYSTIIHEEGHMLGLGHGGPYNSGDGITASFAARQSSIYDNRLWTTMSYIDPADATAKDFAGYTVTGTQWGNTLSSTGQLGIKDPVDSLIYSDMRPTTPMMLDILAVQRIYGLPTSGPLANGGQHFGFNTNIPGDVGDFFNFNINKNPILTIWDGGANNVLDLSGFTADSTVSLLAGGFSSVNGQTNNIVIALGTVIDKAIGGSGKDTITGNDHSNVLDGGAGIDTLIGGLGNDGYIVDSASDVVIETAGEGYDVVYAKVSYSLLENIESLVLMEEAGASSGVGNSGDNLIQGNSFDNVLSGWTGADTMYGGQGNDTYLVENLSDAPLEASNEGIDTVVSQLNQYTLPSNIENLRLLDTAYIGTGNELDNVITGNSVANILVGGAGFDTLQGSTGDDVYALADTTVVDFAFLLFDAVVEAPGEGTDTVYVNTQLGLTDYTLTANVENAVVVGAGNFDLVGNEINNTLTGNASANALSGLDGNDVLDGGAGADSLFGGAGDDFLTGGAGADVLNGGADNDTANYLPSSEGVTVNLTTATASGGDALGDTLNGIENIWGSNRPDLLVGSGMANTLSGFGGNDTLDGAGGDDFLDGGAGADSLVGGEGNDTAGYFFSPLGVTIKLTVGTGDGGDATDDTLNGIENVWGSNQHDVLIGDGVANTLSGFGSDDALDGGSGDDFLDGGAGSDMLFGGAGNDTAGYFFSPQGVTIKLTLGTGDGGDSTGDSLSGIENVWGSNHDDILIGDGLPNFLAGFSGNDVLAGGGGDDTLAGGIGDDTYMINDAGDSVVENLNEGTDAVIAPFDYSLLGLPNVENLTLTGLGNINGIGNDLNNTIIGNSGDNVLNGGNGDDVLTGGAGADALIGGGGFDYADYGSAQGGVTADLAISEKNTGDAAGDTFAGFEGLTGSTFDDFLSGDAGNNKIFGGAGDDTMEGRAGDDQLTGEAGNDQLNGGAGDDQLTGGIGDDSYIVDSLNDVVIENADEGIDTVVASLSYSLATLPNVENLTLTGVSNIDATGNFLKNTITGSLGNNKLDGGGNIDTLIGNAGDDTYVIYSKDDVVVENAGEGIDTVVIASFGGDFVFSYTLGANLENLTLTSFDRPILIGNSENNIIIGNTDFNELIGLAGNDTLDGGVGADRMTGGIGDDIYIVDNVDDIILELAGEGTDEVRTSLASYTLDGNVENLRGLGTAGKSLSGNALFNAITGGSGNDTLNGTGGVDTLAGGGGSDKFVLDSVALSDAKAATPIFDHITDYNRGNTGSFNPAEADQIDVSAIVGTAFSGGQAVAALLRVVDDASNAHALLQVDADGTVNGISWTTIAQLDGLHGSDSVNIIVNGSQPGGTSVSVLSNNGHFGDLDGDDQADLVWRNDDGSVATWQMNGGTVAAGNFLPTVTNDWHILGTGDFNADGRTDIVWQNDNGTLLDWQMASSSTIGSSFGIGTAPANSYLAGTGDFDADGKSDLAWRDLTSGVVTINTMAGTTSTIDGVGNPWSVVGVGDFNGDGKADVMFRNASLGVNAAILTDAAPVFYPGVPNDWHVEGTGDFDGNGAADLLWHNDNGGNAIWLMGTDGNVAQAAFFDGVSADWHVVGTGDFDGRTNNGHPIDDVVWRNDAGATAIWIMNGTQTPTVSFPGGVPNDWATQAHHYEYV